MTDGIRWIRRPADLAAFRAGELAVAKVLGAIIERGATVLALDPGVGKSTVTENLVDEVRRRGPFDLIVFLTSQRRNLEERAFVRDGGDDLVVLEPRPRKKCGALNDRWTKLEKAGCSSLGRRDICSTCAHRSSCTWPDQLTKTALEGKRIVAATQALLILIPDLIPQLQRATGAAQILVILDESSSIDARMRVSIPLDEIEKNRAALNAVRAMRPTDKAFTKWAHALDLVLDPDVSLADIPRMFPLGSDITSAIQDTGIKLFGDAFRYRLFDIRDLLRCPRWRGDGSVGFIRRPRLDGFHYLILAAGIPISVVRQRLDAPELNEMHPGVRFLHEKTEVFNLRSGLGAAVNFTKNAPQILFAAAQLVAKLAVDRKRSIIVSKKRFTKIVSAMLERYLRELTGDVYRVVHDPDVSEIDDPLVVPIVTFGAVGSNAFEGFDAAIAVNSYNSRVETLGERLNDAHHPDEEIRVAIDNDGRGRQGRARGYIARRQGYDDLAREYHAHLEVGVAVQAVGRVRFATQPRFVIFFQNGDVPYPLTKEFRNLDAMRNHFGLITEREWRATQNATAAKKLADAGKSTSEICAELGISERSVRRAKSGKIKTKGGHEA